MILLFLRWETSRGATKRQRTRIWRYEFVVLGLDEIQKRIHRRHGSVEGILGGILEGILEGILGENLEGILGAVADEDCRGCFVHGIKTVRLPVVCSRVCSFS